MNVGPYVPRPRKAAERRCYLKYIAVDRAPGFLCSPLSCPWVVQKECRQGRGGPAWQGRLLGWRGTWGIKLA